MENTTESKLSNFQDDLTNLFGDRMRSDEEFCKNIWSALANVIWRNIDGAEASYTFRAAGGLIAEIIDGGDYMDWYCCGPDSVVSEEIAKGLASCGWSHHDYEC